MIRNTTKATMVAAMMPWLIPQPPNGGTAENSGLNSGGTIIVSGQITEVVMSHCFQTRRMFCAAIGGVNQKSCPA